MMNAEDNKRAVMATWKAFASRDPAEIAAMFTEDAQWFAPPGNATAIALNATHHMMGKAKIVHFIAVDFGKLFSRDVKVDFAGFYGDGNVVVVEQRLQATLSNGAPYDNDYCFVLELEDGRIRRVREYMDTAKGHRMIFAAA
ncbi:nuclear transport factor 2 family protein [Methylocapsa sp. S129]|uniref:nuclear transport factor 2 family protein n=1 Tax=Methylocapsa sp. S129 TaxID=1641869 RepID=UPI001FEFC4FE|nr:nuclear transport factor 2 family protein [Methylocapsa sp. S129]